MYFRYFSLGAIAQGPNYSSAPFSYDHKRRNALFCNMCASWTTVQVLLPILIFDTILLYLSCGISYTLSL